MRPQLGRGLRRYFRRPPVVLQLALLAALLSAAIIVVLAVGSAQVLLAEGSEGLPLVYLLLAAASVLPASALSAALRRWPVVRIAKGVALGSVPLTIGLRAALALELPGVSVAICVVAYLLEIVFDTLFWLSASEHLPAAELKRHTPFLAAAFGLGGFAAGIASTLFCEIFPGEDLLLLDAAVFALCFVQYRRILRLHAPADVREAEAAEPGVLKALKATTGVIRAFPIAAAISAAVLLMSALFCLQDYLAMTAFQQAFPDADKLSSFLARLYASQQAVELLVLLGCGSLILGGAGPIVRNLIFPITTCVGLVVLHASWSLPAAVLVHVNAIALSNAVFEPVKTLNFAALPHRVLAQVRMLVECVVYPLGLAAAALSLLWLQSRTGPQAILEITIVVAGVFAAVSALVGVAFLPSLLRSLRLRAISPSEYVRAECGRVFSARDIRRMLEHPDDQARRFGVHLAGTLAPELLSAAYISETLAADDLPAWPAPGRRAEPAPDEPAEEHAVRLRHDDFAAAGVRPPLGSGVPIPRGGVRSRRADAKIWPLAMTSRVPTPDRLEDIGRGLEDRSIAIRRATARLLARLGAAAVPTAAKYLRSERPEVVEAAIRALGGIGTRRAEELLREHLRPLYLRAQLNLEALDAVQGMRTAPEGARLALETWLIESNRWIMRRALLVKSALGNPKDIKLLDALIRAHEPRARSGAVEALVSLPTKRFIQPLVSLLDAGSRPSVPAPPGGDRRALPDGRLLALQKATAASPWGRLLAARLIDGADHGKRPGGVDAMLDLVLFLKTTPLFRSVPLEDIARVARLAQPVAVEQGDTIADADDPVRHIYVVRNGAIELRLNGVGVEVAAAGASIGEAAVFGEERHVVSARAASPALLLRFPISIIADLVAENPEVLGPVALDLSARLNRLRARLAMEAVASAPCAAG